MADKKFGDDLQGGLFIAARDGDLAGVKQALAAGASANQPHSVGGGFPLPMAALFGHVEIVKTLLAAGADPAVPPKAPALSEAAKSGHVEIVKALVAAGAPMNVQSDTGYTALHWAAAKNEPLIAEVLLAAGADPTIKDERGNTPAWIASELQHVRVLSAIEAAEPPEAAQERAQHNRDAEEHPIAVAVSALPVWIATGFAARCARHALPFFEEQARKTTLNLRLDIFRALHVAELFGGRGRATPNYSAAADGDHAIDAYQGLAHELGEGSLLLGYGDAAAAAAYVADIATGLAVKASWARRDTLEANAARAVRGACECEPVRATIMAELTSVVEQCRTKRLDDASPFSTIVLPALPELPRAYGAATAKWTELE